MHLAINGVDIGRRRGGNESYLLGLLAGLHDLAPLPRLTLLVNQGGTGAARAEAPDCCRVVDMGAYYRLPFYLWQQTQVLQRVQPDWYISTFFLPPVTPCRAAVLVHDLSFRAHPEYFPTDVALYMRLLTGLAIRRAECVVVLSQFTREELARFHPEALAKSVVVYPGVGPEFNTVTSPREEATLERYGLTPGYIMALGNIHPRKNLARLLEAYISMRQRRSTVPLMVWGGLQRWDSAHLAQQAQAAGVVLPGFIAQEDLPVLYRHAAMLVYPSLYEGFGLPPLEAMACGTPVITGNLASLPEAVGEAALMVDPTSVPQIADAMARLLDDVPLRNHLSQASLLRARNFTWANTAAHLVAALCNGAPGRK
jgi:glycosyltransferase involved in cell wall biosynthesis